MSTLVAIIATGLSITPAQALPTDGDYICATGVYSNAGDGPAYEIQNGVVMNGGGCTGAVVILAGPTSIGPMAFQSSTLTSITIPDTVEAIGEAAFNASGITSIAIPDSVRSIGVYAFANASGLSSITIPEGVTSIGAYAFRDADSLVEITIPASVTTVGGFAFSEANYLTSFYFSGDAPTNVGANAFVFYRPRWAYIQPGAKGFQVSDPDAFGYGISYEQIYWEDLIVRPDPPYVSSDLFREWKTPLLATQTGPKVGETVYASAFERPLDPSLLIDPSLIDDVSFTFRPEEYVYRVTKQENDASSSVDRQSHSAYESLTKAEQDSWYEEMGFDPVDEPGQNPYQFSWRAFICVTRVQDGEVFTETASKPTNLAVSHASRDDTTDFYMGDQRRNRDFMFRDLTARPSYTGIRTVVGNYFADFYKAGRDYIGRGASFSLGVTEVTSDCGENRQLLALPILDMSDQIITSKSFVIPKDLKLLAGEQVFDFGSSEGVTIGVTGGGPLFDAALFGLTTIASATTPPTASPTPQIHFVTFDPNGGLGIGWTIGSNSPAPLPLNSLSRKGYVFSGWNTKADGSGVAYADQASYGFGSDIYLYAQWSLVSGKKLIKTFAGNKATVTTAMKVSVSKWVKTFPMNSALVCQGSTSGSKITAFDKKLAATRAKNVCDYAVKIRKDITYKITVKPSSSTALAARSVWMYFN